MTDKQHGVYHETDTVEPALTIEIDIQWLAGVRFVDIRHVCGCSVSSVFRYRGMVFVHTVVDFEELDIAFHDTYKNLKASVSKFAKKSSKRVMIVCVGTIDGLFVRVRRL